MIVSRRGVLAGALAVPTVAGLAGWQWRQGAGHSGAPLLLFDPSLDAGQRFAAAGEGFARQITGDPIRLMQALLPARPGLIAGVSRHAEALLVIEAAHEAGYVLAGEIRGTATGCSANTCHAGWVPLTRMAVSAGPAWVEALAAWAINPQARALPALPAAASTSERALGWVLVPR
jgi:hypothetical protein